MAAFTGTPTGSTQYTGTPLVLSKYIKKQIFATRTPRARARAR